MVDLNDETIEKIADTLHDKLRKSAKGTDFYIAPEVHYNAHKDMAQMYKDWQGINDIFKKIFIGFIVVGALVIAGVGAMSDWLKGRG